MTEKSNQLLGIVFERSEDDHGPGLTLTIEKQMRGDGDIDFLCGACFTVLGENMGEAFFGGDVPIRCPDCRAWNKIPIAD